MAVRLITYHIAVVISKIDDDLRGFKEKDRRKEDQSVRFIQKKFVY